jgi:hypothetical protein
VTPSIKPKSACRHDLVALGEVMLRLDPGDTRISTTRSVRAREDGGDSLATGLFYGFSSDKGPQWAVDSGAAHGSPAMTTPGDTTGAILGEVDKAMKGMGARVVR